jgi:ribosomal protein S18 acetylase RimI-like enzyme
MQIHFLSPSHHDSLVALLCELHAYYHNGAVVAPDIMRAHLVDYLLAADSPLRLVVACDEQGQVIGFAAISLVYSLVEPAPEKRRQCALKELYIRASQRSRGAGKALMAWVARYAVENGCARIDWPVKASNARGIAFYERLGAQQVVERLSYRLDGDRLGELDRLSDDTPGD